MSEYILELSGITKVFPGVKALDRVDFQLKEGEIHALMGENGAGKSTFIKVITGVHHAEEGEMFLDGKKVEFKSPLDAQRAGIAAIYQHVTSYPHLSVTENIFMGHEDVKKGFIQWKDMHKEADALLSQLNAEFPSTALMSSLSVHGRPHHHHGRTHRSSNKKRIRRALPHYRKTARRWKVHHLHLTSS
jgi:rhamnose transport system ATP-binding protein